MKANTPSSGLDEAVLAQINRKCRDDRLAGWVLTVGGSLWSFGVWFLLAWGFTGLFSRLRADPSLIAWMPITIATVMVVGLFLLRPREAGSLDTLARGRKLAYSTAGSPMAYSPMVATTTRSLMLASIAGSMARTRSTRVAGSFWFHGGTLMEIIAGGLRMVRDGVVHFLDARRRSRSVVTAAALRVYCHLADGESGERPIEAFEAWLGDDTAKLAGLLALHDAGLIGKRTIGDPQVYIARTPRSEEEVAAAA